MLRRWIGSIMCVIGFSSTIFFSYVKVSNLWNIVDEAGNATSQGGILILILGSLLLFAKGVQVLIHKDKSKNRKKFTFTIPDL